MNNWLKVTLALLPLSLLSYDISPVLAFLLMFAAVAAGYAGKWGETCDDCEAGNRCPEAPRKYPCRGFKERRNGWEANTRHAGSRRSKNRRTSSTHC